MENLLKEEVIYSQEEDFSVKNLIKCPWPILLLLIFMIEDLVLAYFKIHIYSMNEGLFFLDFLFPLF